MGMINIRWSVAQAGDETSNGQPSVKRLLLIKLRYLGDVVLSTPVLPPLRKQFPDAKITFLVNPGTAAVLQGNPRSQPACSQIDTLPLSASMPTRLSVFLTPI